MDLGLHIAVHARKKSFLRHTGILSPYLVRALHIYETARANAQAVDVGLKRLYFSLRVGAQRRPAENVG
jgi:hypothetical protein